MQHYALYNATLLTNSDKQQHTLQAQQSTLCFCVLIFVSSLSQRLVETSVEMNYNNWQQWLASSNKHLYQHYCTASTESMDITIKNDQPYI